MKKIGFTLCIFLVAWFPLLGMAAGMHDPFLQKQMNSKVALESLSERWFDIRFYDIPSMAKKVKKILSKRGELLLDESGKQIWVRDTGDHLVVIEDLIRTMDQPIPQIKITARIVSVDIAYAKELGLRFSMHQSSEASSFMGDRFHFNVQAIAHHSVLDIALSALESHGHGRVVSAPELVVGDKHTATIESGEEIPYQEKTSSGATSVNFKKAVLSLKVTPCVLMNKKIAMQLHISQDQPSDLIVEGVPAIKTRSISSDVVVNNNEGIVLGGIYEQVMHKRHTKIPYLDRIPIFGKWLGHKHHEEQRRMLLVFITPSIMSLDEHITLPEPR